MDEAPLLLDLVLPGVVLPVAVSAIILCLARRLGAEGWRERAAGALAMLAGFLASYAAFPWAPWRPIDPWDWLPSLLLFALVVGLWEKSLPAVVRWLPRLVVAGVAGWVLIPNHAEWQTARNLWLGTVAGTVALLWFLLNPLTVRWPGKLFPALIALVAFAAGLLLEQGAGIMKLAQLAGVLGAVIIPCALWDRAQPPRSFMRGMIPGVAVGLPAVLFSGYFNTSAGMPLAVFLLPAVAPLAFWIGAIPGIEKLAPRWRMLVQAGAVLLPLALAMGIVFLWEAE